MTWNWGLIFQLFALAITVAVLVILIVVLARNPDTNDPQQINNKVNWLYALEIASVSLMLIFAIISAVMYWRYK
jgi:hypothetical protein